MPGSNQMNNATLLGSWLRRFLLEHLVAERNLARNTQRSYRDTLVLLIPFVAKKLGKAVDRLTVIDLSADLIRVFLAHLEESRRCAIATRNQRLAAIHALARFVGEHSPEHIAWCAQLRAIPFKKTTSTVIPYLDMDFPQTERLRAVTKVAVGIHGLLTYSLFGDGILRRLLLRVSLAKA